MFDSHVVTKNTYIHVHCIDVHHTLYNKQQLQLGNG